MLSERIFAVAQVADQVILYILIALSVISIGLILERFFSLRKVAKESQKVRTKIKSALQSNSLDEVEGMAKDHESLEGRALSYALRHIKDNGSRGLEEVFNTYMLTEKPELERSLSFLATIGSNAPYIGLLGTVMGIMKAFQDLATTTDAGQQTVMAGISLALVATAAGLFVAIPAVMAYNYFQRQVKGILQSLDSAKELCLAYAKKKESKMASKYGADDSEAISDINVVPLVDIILVVLIIFMVTAPMFMKPSINVNLPKAATGEQSVPTQLTITITKEGQTLLNGVAADDAAITAQAQDQVAKNADIQAIISADQDVPHGKVVHVIDVVKASGVKKFAISIDKPQ